MGLWITDVGDPWQSTIFGPYANVKGSYWNCSTASVPVCGNFTDNVKLINPNWTLIGRWHQLPSTCSVPGDCLAGNATGYAPKNHSIVINNNTVAVQLRYPPLRVNESDWARVRFEGGSVVNFNASKPWGWDDPMPICVFPLSGTYGPTQRIWFYITLVFSISDFFPELLRLVSLGNVVTTSFAAAIQQIQLYNYRPSVTKIVDLDAIAGAHILAITMWATVYWTIYSRIFGERLKVAYRAIAHAWLIFILTAFLMGTRAKYWTHEQLEVVESGSWYRFTSPCYVNLGGATNFWSGNAFANSTIRSVNEASLLYLPRDHMHSFTYNWDRMPFQVGHGMKGPPMRIWLVLPAIFALVVGTLVPRPTWPPREVGESWPKYWVRRRRGKANFIFLGVLGPACFVVWPGTVCWRSYAAFFGNPAFPAAENPARIGQWSTTVALMLAIFTAIDHFVPSKWKEQKSSDPDAESDASGPVAKQEDVMSSGALAPLSTDLVRAEEGRAVIQEQQDAGIVQLIRSTTERTPAHIVREGAETNSPLQRSATH